MTRPPLHPLPDALQLLLQGVGPRDGLERVPLVEACGRVLASDQLSVLDLPPWDNSAMDGYAVNHADAGRRLPVTLRIAAGDPPGRLGESAAARIFTGAPLPSGADAVLMQEDARFEGDEIRVSDHVRAGQHVRRRGEECQVGERILAAGRRLRPQDIGMLAAQGFAEVDVKPQLRVALLSTGSELVEPGTAAPEPGLIYNSNRPMLLALLRALGCSAVDLGNVQDSAEATRAALKEAAASSDLIISTGGVSVGEEDHVRSAVDALGELTLWRIAVKPGKPFAHGRVGHCPFIGLPGNPASAFVTFLLLARPWIERRQGRSESRRLRFTARADFSRDGSAGREEYLRVVLESQPGAAGGIEFARKADTSGNASRAETGDRALWATPFRNQSSGILRSVSAADALACVPAGRPVKQGDEVEVLPLDQLLS
ncbi:MAG: gephyrin-like molybdotransferase Glp [Pseudomonadota bacterium]